MRYYDFCLSTNAEQIKKNAKINLREYAYDNPIGAMNGFVGRNVKNGVNFLAYREEENATYASFCYNEQKMTFQDAYEHILEMLDKDLGVNRIRQDPSEITMYDFLDDLMEARRRDFMGWSVRFLESANLWIYNYNM